MPSLSAVPRRRQLSDNDDDDEGGESSNPSPSTSNKKRRLNLESTQATGHNDDSSQHSGDEGSDDHGTPEPTQANPTSSVAHATGPGGFKPGAIVRIKLKDFVTYSNAEFFPGPKLNMVIGPNGTGKSTLVCAICLGLGWGPQV